MQESVRRWAGYGGLIFFLLVAVATFATPSAPGTNATAAKVVSYYHQHQGIYFFKTYLIVVAVVVGLTYFWYLRDYLTGIASSRRLLTVAFAGAVVFAVSGTIGAGLSFALADASHAGNLSGTSMQTLNLLSNDLNQPIDAAGTATFLLATGIAIIRNGGLPRWLGWAGLLLGVISLTGFAGPIAIGLWILLASITVVATSQKTITTSPQTRVTPTASATTEG